MQRIFEYFNPAYDRLAQYVAGCAAAFVGYFLPVYRHGKICCCVIYHRLSGRLMELKKE